MAGVQGEFVVVDVSEMEAAESNPLAWGTQIGKESSPKEVACDRASSICRAEEGD